MYSILYVDDEPSLLELGKVFLERSGTLRIDTALSAADAIKKLETQVYDAIISDYQMPEMDGIAFLKYLRTHGQHLPFILFTGRGREEVVIEALNSGADFYLQKGGDPKSQFAELEHKTRQALSRKQAENAVKESDQRLLDIINFLPDATFAIDTGGHVIAWNKAIEKMTGVPARTILGKGNYEYSLPFYGERRPILIDLVSVPEEELLQSKYSNIKKEGDILIAETSLPHPMGRYSVLLGKASILYNPGREVVGAIESIRDITESRRTETGLRESEEKYRSLAEASLDPIFIVDRDDTVLYVNSRAAQVLNRSAGQILGKPRTSLFPPDIAIEQGSHLQMVFDTGKPVRKEARILYGDHEVWQDNSLVPLKDENGNVSAILGISHDITERKLAEEAVKRSERHLADIINFLPDATLAIDREGKVIAWNRAMEVMTEVPSRQMLGKGDHEYALPFYGCRRPMLIDLVFASDEEIEKNYYHIIRKEGDVIVAESDLPRPLGKVVHLWGKASPLYDEKGTKIAAIESIRDVTDRKRAEEALKESEARLNSIVHGSPMLQFVIDKDHRVISWNKAIEEYSGIRSADIVGTRDQWKAFYESERPVLADLLVDEKTGLLSEWYQGKFSQSRLVDGAYEATDFFPMMGASGKWLYFTAAPIRDAQGTIIGAVETLEDITERKQAEEALILSERRLADIIDHLPDATLAIDREGKVIAWNRAIEEMTGVKAADMLGKGDHEYGIPFYGARRPILIDWIFVSDEELEKQYTIIQQEGDLIVAEVDLVLPDGRKVSLWGKASPLYDETGTKIGAIESIRDVTDRKRAELALKQSEDKYRTLFENSGSPLMIVDEDTTILLVNREFENISGYAKEEINGRKSWTEFIAERQDLEKMKEYHRLRRIGPDLAPTSYESRIINRNGDIRNAIITVAMIPATQQSLAAFVDITERKKAEEELRKLYGELEKRVVERTAELSRAQAAYRQANEKLNLLNSITRHDINNQLTVLMGYLAILENKQPDPSFSEYFRKVSAAAQRIFTMIQFTKEYDKIGVNSPTWQDCRTLVDTAAKQAPLGQVMVKNVLPAGAEVFADPLIIKVCYNLMDNAVRYGEKITTIRFSVEEREGDHLIICEDDGNGIVAEEKEKIFERGFGKNTGLGLFLSREILSITGITIRETGEPGNGARFEMTVPKGAYRFTGTP